VKEGGGYGLIEIKGDCGEKSAPVFTDKDLAEAFRSTESPLLDHYSTACIVNESAMIKVLTIFSNHGFTHVAIDPETKLGRWTRFFSIPLLQSKLRSETN
jgi:hypothetical protein